MSTPLRARSAPHPTRRPLTNLVALAAATLLLAACGSGGDDAQPLDGTELLALDLSVTPPTTVDSGTRIEGDATVRTDEADGVRVWLLPSFAPGEDAFYFYAGSELIEEREFTVRRSFTAIVGDADVTLDGVRVRGRSATRDVVLDENVDGTITVRSVGTTSLTLTPPSGTVDQGEPIDVSVAIELDTERDIVVTVAPLSPDGYDPDADGPWTDQVDEATGSFVGVGTATLEASFTVLDRFDGPADIDRVLVTIADADVGDVYVETVDVDLTFAEPTP